MPRKHFKAHFLLRMAFWLVYGLNVFIAYINQGVGPQVFPTLVTALPLKLIYNTLVANKSIFLKWTELKLIIKNYDQTLFNNFVLF